MFGPLTESSVGLSGGLVSGLGARIQSWAGGVFYLKGLSVGSVMGVLDPLVNICPNYLCIHCAQHHSWHGKWFINSY